MVNAEDAVFSLPFPMVVIGRDGSIVYANQKFEGLCRRSISFLKGKVLTELLSLDEGIIKKINTIFNNPMEIYNLKFKGFLLHLSPVMSSDGVKGVMIVFQANPESERVNNLGVFLKGLSHELKNPLSGIEGAARVLRETKTYDEDLIDVLIQESQRMKRLVGNIEKDMDFSKLRISQFNLILVISSIVKLFSYRSNLDGIEIIEEVDPSLPDIYGDRDKLTQAIINILKNAMESGTNRVIIKAGYSLDFSNSVYIIIEDKGQGMDENQMSNLFTPFFSTKKAGKGLGMFITNEIIKQHSGKLSVKSKKGKGTKVKIILPIKRNNGKGTYS